MPVLADVLSPKLAVVFCGTAAGAASAAANAYYAKPGNKFWRTLHEIGLTPRQLDPHECWRVNRYGIGLTDLAKSVAGNDSVLKPGDFDVKALQRKVAKFRPAVLAFTSKRAGNEYFGYSVEYGLQREQLAQSRIFVLNSTSGQATAHWNNAQKWHELAIFLRKHGCAA